MINWLIKVVVSVMILSFITICFIFWSSDSNTFVSATSKKDSVGSSIVSSVTLSEQERAYLTALGSVTMCVDPDWLPFEQLDKTGNFTGIAADLIRLVEERLGLNFVIVPTADWTETLNRSRAGECLVLPFLNQTPAREEWLVFTEPLYIDENVIVTRDEHPYIRELSGVSGRTIALPEGTSIEERVRRDFPNLKVITTATEIEALELVERKKADMTIRSLAVVAYSIRQEGFINLKIAGRAPDEYTNYLRMAVIKEEPELRDILNKGIATITSAEREEITNRHIYVKMEEGINYNLLWQLLVVVVLASVVFIMMYDRRRKQLLEIERLHKEAELAKAHFHNIFQLMPEPVVITDFVDFKIIDYNQAFLKVSGYTIEDIEKGVTASKFMFTKSEDDKNKVKQLLQEKGYVKNYELLLDNKVTAEDSTEKVGEVSSKLLEHNEQCYVLHIVRDVTEARNMEKLIRELSITDKLTQIYNRLRLDELLEESYSRLNRSQEKFSIILADIDRFKAINDNYGHQIGDGVLKEFAAIIKNSIRSTDYVGRWGGEEFLVIAPNTDIKGAALLAEKIRMAIAEYEFVEQLKITCSFGVAEASPDKSVAWVIDNADVALYKAKGNGRNRVEQGMPEVSD